MAQKQGGRWAQATPLMVADYPPRQNRAAVAAWSGALQSALKQNPVLVMCLIPGGNKHIYSFVKHTLAVSNGVVSQCVTDKTLADQKLFMPGKMCDNTVLLCALFCIVFTVLGIVTYHPWLVVYRWSALLAG